MPEKEILIVDDDDSFRTLMREVLQNLGYGVREAASGNDALKRLQEQIPDLVLLDIMMPDIDGVSLCREIRAQEATATVPVLIVSALADSDTVNDALLFGATDFIVKPMDLDALQVKVEKALTRRAGKRNGPVQGT